MPRSAPWILLMVLASSLVWRPKEAAPSEWPVERFVRNLEARLAAHPDDAGAHFTLGRVHAFAFALRRPSLLGGGSEELTWLNDLERQRGHEPELGLSPPGPEELRTHLIEGIRHLQRACELQETALHRLTLAWLLESGAPSAAAVDSAALFAPSTPEECARWAPRIAALGAAEGERAAELARELWIERAIEAYRRCIERVEADGLLADPMVQGPASAQVPREALDAYRRLVRARGVQDPEEERFLAHADALSQELDDRPPRRAWITPIVVPLPDARCPSLAELTRGEARVPFDLDGDGVDELWPWIGPEAGWLVWDPCRRGEIVSGRALFGSASAWLFFTDGYRVLDALDDDGDGALRGCELAGIAVWIDRDGDGVSDRGEVVPLEALGITALACAATGVEGRSPMNPSGLELADGRVLPTWDWVLSAEPTP